ncbi:sigma-70 family RNA polymerase sigma factor [Pendulispora albinea]|uniref:Sigma-70 family RNA polymerase sigma factor n=1 Tax=Pendulispora albinea TaxID=2741071 RepID=A0ABZ2M3H8_9BACT
MILSMELQTCGFDAPDGWETIEQRLRDMVAAGRAAWPTVVLEERAFVRYVAERLARTDSILGALESLHASDLYLACGCVKGNEAALAAFDGAMRKVAEVALRRMWGTGPRAASPHEHSPSHADDALQALSTRLLVPVGDAPPRIAEYSGRGDLRGWFRVAITREALSAARATKREVGLDERSMAMTPCTQADPELSHLRRRFASEFSAAFAEAARSLESAERNLLRHHYLDGLSIDEIGAIYRIHRVTAARRLNRAREALVLATRRLLAERLNATPSELQSAMRALDGVVDITLRNALCPTDMGTDATSQTSNSHRH